MLSRLVTMVTFLLLVVLVLPLCHPLTQLGTFTSFQHGIQGTLLEDRETGGRQSLKIINFSYDGKGPPGSTFFYVVNSSWVYSPEDVGRGYSGSQGFKVILPFPFQGLFYDYTDPSAPAIDRKFEEEEVELVLPEGMEVGDITFLSVWCRRYETNFG